MTTVIGIVGPAGSGKTTAAQYLARAYGAEVYAFATPLKEILHKAFDLPRESLWGTQVQKESLIPGWNVSGRWFMQRLGTDGIRAVLGEDFWAKTILKQIDRESPRLAVVEDVRFMSESNALRLWGYRQHPAYLWKLIPPELREWSVVPEATDPTHQSESEWREITPDHIIAPERKYVPLLHAGIDEACALFDIKPVLHSIEAP